MMEELELLTAERVVAAIAADPATSLEHRLGLFGAILQDGPGRKRVASHLRAVAQGTAAFDPAVVPKGEAEPPPAKRCRASS